MWASSNSDITIKLYKSVGKIQMRSSVIQEYLRHESTLILKQEVKDEFDGIGCNIRIGYDFLLWKQQASESYYLVYMAFTNKRQVVMFELEVCQMKFVNWI